MNKQNDFVLGVKIKILFLATWSTWEAWSHCSLSSLRRNRNGSIEYLTNFSFTCSLLATQDDVAVGYVRTRKQTAEITANQTAVKQAKVQSIKTQYAAAITVSNYSVYIGIVFITLFYGVFILNDSFALALVLKKILSKKIKDDRNKREKNDIMNICRTATIEQEKMKQSNTSKNVDLLGVLKLEHQINSKLSKQRDDAKKNS